MELQQIVIAAFSMVGGQAIILALIHFGFKAFKTWFMAEVVKPHISPIQKDISQIKDQQAQHTALVEKHDSDLEKYKTYTLLLLGKVMGGVPNIDLMEELDKGIGPPPAERREE